MNTDPHTMMEITPPHGTSSQMMSLASARHFLGPATDYRITITGANSSRLDSIAGFGFKVSGTPSKDRRLLAKLLHDVLRRLRRGGSPTAWLLATRPVKWLLARFRITGTSGPLMCQEGVSPQEKMPKKITRVSGFFTDCDYLDTLNPSFRELFLLDPNKRSPWFVDQYERIKSADSVGIHVRRGDFAKIHDGILDMKYYIFALEYLSSRGQNLRSMALWLFSDEPVRAASDFESTFPDLDFQAVNAPTGTPAAEVLSLLASCNTIIAANSTFSWCAVHLSRAKSTAIAPPSHGVGNTFDNCSHVISIDSS